MNEAGCTFPRSYLLNTLIYSLRVGILLPDKIELPVQIALHVKKKNKKNKKHT